MKKSIIIALFLGVSCLVGCSNNTVDIEEPVDIIEKDTEKIYEFTATVIEVTEKGCLVTPVEDSNELKSSDKIYINTGETYVKVNDIIKIEYDGMIAESYPAQILNVFNIDIIEEVVEEIVVYNGIQYYKKNLSKDTLRWLELSEEEQILSSYFPEEFVNIHDWGINLDLLEFGNDRVVIECTQNGKDTQGELQTSSYYILERWSDTDGWIEVEHIIEDEAWTAEAYIIPKNNTTRWDINWTWLYGIIGPGKYRLGKEITEFRDTGDYDTQMYYVEFILYQ